MLAARVGGHRRGSPYYSYNAGSAGLVDGAGYPAHIWVVGCCYWRNLVRGLECVFITTVPIAKLFA